MAWKHENIAHRTAKKTEEHYGYSLSSGKAARIFRALHLDKKVMSANRIAQLIIIIILLIIIISNTSTVRHIHAYLKVLCRKEIVRGGFSKFVAEAFVEE